MAEVDETSLREKMLSTQPIEWPPIKDGPLEEAITTKIVVDRTGKVRELGTIVSDNPGLSEASEKTIRSMQFKPYLQDGVPVQVVSRITMPFKTVRPAGVEKFDSARNYFERGRHVSFPATGAAQAYILHPTFQVQVAGERSKMASISILGRAMTNGVVVSFASAPNAPDTSKQKNSIYAEIGKAPGKARARQNPFRSDPETIAAGGILYAQHCAECHGSKAEGRKRGPSLLVSEVQRAEPGAIFWILTNGVVRRGMPGWSKLPEPQRCQVVSFLKSLRNPSPIPIEESAP